MLGALVPVGTRYLHARKPFETASEILGAAWAPFTSALLSSGTAALALALRAVLSTRGRTSGQVLLPAYGCPSLLAAVNAAGCDAVLIDTAPGRWGYDIPALRAALGEKVVAVLAVDLFGTGDHARELASLCSDRSITLIQDSAQSMPPDVASAWIADLVILSFGRGKPLNLLGGGALLYRSAATGQTRLATEVNTHLAALGTSEAGRFRQRVMGAAYNALTTPLVFSIASRLPGLHLGDTCYATLTNESRLAPAVLGDVAVALEAYRADTAIAQARLTATLPRLREAGYECLSGSHWPALADRRLLRFPVLARDAATCARAHALLRTAGLGGSRMYEKALPEIAGVPDSIRCQGPFFNASDLAQRLLTLPIHHRVSDSHVEAMVSTLLRAAASH